MAINAVNGVAVTTSSAINGQTGLGYIQGVALSSGGGGGITLVATDNFDSYSNASALGSQTNWTGEGGTLTVANTSGTAGTVFPNSSGAVSLARWNANAAALNQRVEVDVASIGSGVYVGPSIRIQSGTTNSYDLRVESGTFNLYAPGGVIASYGSLPSGIQKLAIEASGSGSSTRVTAQIDTGSGWTTPSGFNAVDPGVGNYLSAGYGGVGGYNSGGVTVDNFKLYQ